VTATDDAAARIVDDALGPEKREEKKSASTRLVELAEQIYRLGVSTQEQPFAVPRNGPRLVRMLRGGKSSMRAQLARKYYTATGKAAPAQALADAMLVLEGRAADCEPETLHLRVAETTDATYLDLADATGRAVRITAGGWEIVNDPPVLFRRQLTAPLPTPTRSGSIDQLWHLLNVAPEDRPLILAWLLCVLAEGMPHPILGLWGEQGTGKTSAAKMLTLLDPTGAGVQKAPRDAEAWITTASGSWIVALDNISALPEWLSDSLCRAVTGAGDVRRQLYSDADLVIFAVKRCLILTGIDLGAVRGDFADRLLPVTLHRIDDDARLEDDALSEAWEQSYPAILGAVLDLAASLKQLLPSVELARKPRMADYARRLAAVDQLLGTEGLAHYLKRIGGLATEALTDDPFLIAMGEHLQVGETFTGTAADLLTRVTPDVERWRAPKGWPATARAVTQQLRRQAPNMRRAGWTVNELPAGHSNLVHWQIRPPCREAGNRASQDSQSRNHAQNGPSGASQDSQNASQDSHGAGDNSHPEPDSTLTREAASHARHKSGLLYTDETGDADPPDWTAAAAEYLRDAGRVRHPELRPCTTCRQPLGGLAALGWDHHGDCELAS